MRIVPMVSCIRMISHQGVELFERIRRTRRCGLVGMGVALLEEVCLEGGGGSFEVSKAHARVNQNVKLSDTASASCKPRCFHRDNNGLNLWL